MTVLTNAARWLTGRETTSPVPANVRSKKFAPFSELFLVFLTVGPNHMKYLSHFQQIFFFVEVINPELSGRKKCLLACVSLPVRGVYMYSAAIYVTCMFKLMLTCTYSISGL